MDEYLIDDLDDEASEFDATNDSADDEAARLIALIDAEKARADGLEAEWRKQWGQAQALLRQREDPNWEPEVPLSPIEKAAQKIAGMPADEFRGLYDRMAAANAELTAKYRARNEATSEREPEPFDANALDGPTFSALMRAVLTGGANPRDVPAGHSYGSWSGFVAERLGR